MKIDTDGNELWFKTYGGVADDWGGMVEPTNDNGYIISQLSKIISKIV